MLRFDLIHVYLLFRTTKNMWHFCLQHCILISYNSTVFSCNTSNLQENRVYKELTVNQSAGIYILILPCSIAVGVLLFSGHFCSLLMNCVLIFCLFVKCSICFCIIEFVANLTLVSFQHME